MHVERSCGSYDIVSVFGVEVTLNELYETLFEIVSELPKEEQKKVKVMIGGPFQESPIPEITGIKFTRGITNVELGEEEDGKALITAGTGVGQVVVVEQYRRYFKKRDKIVGGNQKLGVGRNYG